ncbi:MAG: hypothetical protein CSYNP_04489 [Syntrophus sp. SKADARSKE-3]|nr:hypothetical protein [Syntrophus sp. SKADARSKE-3]
MNEIKLQTIVTPDEPSTVFSSESVISGVGSCFSQNVLGHLYECGMNVTQNPNGIIYNTHSIYEALKRVVNNELYKDEEFFDFNGKWHSWRHHGMFSNSDLNQAVEGANQSLADFRAALSQSDLFFMTPSSSVVYEYTAENRIVANCHKVPNNQFASRLLSVEENYNYLCDTVNLIKSFNPECLIVMTVSPVRHYPGNLVLNTRSKANLIAAMQWCLEENEDIVYFPAYEIVLDELRDYRFFKDDMLHPNELAQKIIFRRFIETFFDQESIVKIEEAEKQLLSAMHRPKTES